MRKNQTPGGKIIATASVAAVVPHEAYPEYAGAKAAVVNFVRATARILKRVGSDCSIQETFVLSKRRKRTSPSTLSVRVREPPLGSRPRDRAAR